MESSSDIVDKNLEYKVSEYAEPADSGRNITNDTGFLGQLKHVDTLKNSDQHERTRRNSKKIKVNIHSDRHL